MLHLLKIEWLKVKNYRTFWIFLAISAVSIPGFNYLFQQIFSQGPKVNGQGILGDPFSYPDVWMTVSYFSTLVLILPAMLLITLTTNEFTFKTHRQNIIDGLSRTQFLSVKLVEILLLAIFTTIIVWFTCIGFGASSDTHKPADFSFSNTRFVLFYFLQCTSYLMIAFMMSMLIKRAGLTIGIYLIYIIIENVIVGIYTAKVKGGHLVNYLPEESNDILIPKPLLRKIMSDPSAAGYWESHLPVYISVALAYLLLYVLFTSWKFRKGDL